MDDEEEIETIEKKEIVTTKIEKFKKGNKIMTLTTRTVKQMDANTFNRYPGIQPTERSLYPDELDLIIAYRVMNKIGKHSLLKVAQEFAMTPTMRNKCIRGI